MFTFCKKSNGTFNKEGLLNQSIVFFRRSRSTIRECSLATPQAWARPWPALARSLTHVYEAGGARVAGVAAAARALAGRHADAVVAAGGAEAGIGVVTAWGGRLSDTRLNKVTSASD